jgi:adenosyl cobinamide kinase/adenosyl cobinamide phosphate guanylyltransferase
MKDNSEITYLNNINNFKYPIKIFVTGGMSSGKSDIAENLAIKLLNDCVKFKNVTSDVYQANHVLHFVATADPFMLDNEMKIKVDEHKKNRSKLFIVHEGFKDLKSEIENIYAFLDSKCCIMLIDSLTMWLSGVFKELEDYEFANNKLNELIACLKVLDCSIITVSDYLSFNIIPTDEYLRKFIQLNGLMEQELSALSNSALCVIAGNVLILK